MLVNKTMPSLGSWLGNSVVNEIEAVFKSLSKSKSIAIAINGLFKG